MLLHIDFPLAVIRDLHINKVWFGVFAAFIREMDINENEEIRERVEKYTRMLNCDDKVSDIFIVS